MWGENKVFGWRKVSGKANTEALVTQTKPKKNVGFLTSQWTIKLVKHVWTPCDEGSKEMRTSALT